MVTPDVVVLGGGSAGFAAAIRAAELGARVTLIEGGTLGGTCVNVGCVPSKTLLRAAEVRHRAAHHPFDGVRTHATAADFPRVMAQKDALVATLRRGKYWDVLAAYPNITLHQGRGIVSGDLSVTIKSGALTAERLIVTTGSSPWVPPIPGLADAGYLTSTEALALTQVPASLIVIGGSAVGLEIAQLYARLETRVTVLGHVQRGGSATAFDRMLGTRFGAKAVELVKDKKFGQMAALRGNQIVDIPIAEGVDKLKTVDTAFYDMARMFFG